ASGSASASASSSKKAQQQQTKQEKLEQQQHQQMQVQQKEGSGDRSVSAQRQQEVDADQESKADSANSSKMNFSLVGDKFLRRYRRAARLKISKAGTTREELVASVTKHFAAQELNEKEAITHFIYALRNQVPTGGMADSQQPPGQRPRRLLLPQRSLLTSRRNGGGGGGGSSNAIAYDGDSSAAGRPTPESDDCERLFGAVWGFADPPTPLVPLEQSLTPGMQVGGDSAAVSATPSPSGDGTASVHWDSSMESPTPEVRVGPAQVMDMLRGVRGGGGTSTKRRADD
ncbi:hypothetical protein HK405_014738, partial [Cladochytrium tenue]